MIAHAWNDPLVLLLLGGLLVLVGVVLAQVVRDARLRRTRDRR